MGQKPGLSRNLAAERAARKAATQQARLVPQGLPTVHPDKLMPSPENGRKELLKIEELAETLITDGMNTAMTVIPPDVYTTIYPQHKDTVDKHVAEGVLFVVHHGHRRLAAAKLAGLTEVPILVRNDVPSLRIAAIQENLQRMGLNPIEEGMEFHGALAEKDESGKQLSQRELARRVGCSQTYVSHRLALLKLVPPLQQAVIDHWLKEQRLLEDEASEEETERRLLLPVREAATVYARLRPDLQESYVRGELTSAQAALISKEPIDEQTIPAADGDTTGDGAPSTDEGHGTHVPEQRSEDSASQSSEGDTSPARPASPSSAQPADRQQNSRDDNQAVAPAAVLAPVATAEEPRGVIVVRGVEALAREIKELLSGDEIEELKNLLTS
ncbi:ParB/RepB/Spo0J family partition protein [Streptomyces sp. NPDC049915]|uniref:ParB/RepB/Spo0J family partition protein n=1 Tax=Streptomyces sp. NPDC049915 TaxID=3155510 RepID=UPI00342B742A